MRRFATRTIFAYEIARNGQSLFGEKCEPDPKMLAFWDRVQFGAYAPTKQKAPLL